MRIGGRFNMETFIWFWSVVCLCSVVPMPSPRKVGV